MEEKIADDLAHFSVSGTVLMQWETARRLMAGTMTRSQIFETAEFHLGFNHISEAAMKGDGADRLLAIDLLVRLSGLKGILEEQCHQVLRTALKDKLPPLTVVAKAAEKSDDVRKNAWEVRENVSAALRFASAEWVFQYAVDALSSEDKSQRCRNQLAKQLFEVEPRVARVISAVADAPWDQLLQGAKGTDAAAGRLKDLVAALLEGMRRNRRLIRVNLDAGYALASLCRRILPLSRGSRIPAKLSAASVEVANLLEEMLNARFDLVVEPDLYAAIEVVERWWQPLPYKPEVVDALAPVVAKVTAAVRLRAKMGQRSERLAARLGQALGPGHSAATVLRAIAEEEMSFAPDVDDWLRGIQRSGHDSGAVLAILGKAGEGRALAAVAELLAEANEMATGGEADAGRLIARIEALARNLGLEVLGNVGQVVEYSPESHSTLDGRLPAEPTVRIIRPLVVRRNSLGGTEVLQQALVAET